MAIECSSYKRGVVLMALACATFALAGCNGATPGLPGANFTPTPVPTGPSKIARISVDPFINASSQHATEVEPDVFATGMTIVAALQMGRFFGAGASDVGFATSHDGGLTWVSGALPGTTVLAAPMGPYDSVSDPSVVFDAKHSTWLIASLPIFFTNQVTPAVLVSRSTDGLTWSNPVSVAPGQAANDKDWITCDDTVTSAFYGHCYVQWDDFLANGLIHMSTSTDGGLTWSAPANTGGNGTGIGGQPLVQPNGTVIVPIDDFNIANVISFVSHDGGGTWTTPVFASTIIDHGVAGNLRTAPLPSAAIDAGGRVYLVWQDCRFRAGCPANDIVLSTSLDGLSWSAPARIPIDSTSSGVDHFIPGVGVDPATSGAGAHVGVTYYYYSNANCTPATCQLFVGFIASQDGGATWGAPVTLAGPMSVLWLAGTSQGQMVGDYIATAYSGGHPYGVFAVANPPGAFFDEAMYVPKPGILTASIGARHSSAGERPVPGVRPNHGPRPRPPIR
jgi:hypothetical protein